MKRIVSIVLTVLLLGLPFMPVAASALPVKACVKCAMPVDCGMPSCCAAQPVQDPQPAPAVPSQSNNDQSLVSFVTFAALVWTLPEHPAGQPASSFVLPSRATGAPLYERNCTLLI